jgi:hypothetical protein
MKRSPRLCRARLFSANILCRAITGALALSVAPGAPPSAARAQETEVVRAEAVPSGRAAAAGAARQPAAPVPQPIQTLEKALEVISWDYARRGPLLVVNPANTPPWTPKREPGDHWTPYTPPKPLPPPPTAGGYKLSDVAAYFGRKVVRLDGLSVLAPTEMVVFNTNPAKPDLFAGVQRGEKQRMFHASLSAAQWRLLGSEQGIGMGDLTPPQRALFLSLLPDPFRLQKVKAMGGGGWSMEGDPQKNLVTLSPEQRAGVRLRVNRAVSMALPSADDSNRFYGAGVGSRPDGTEFFTLLNRDYYQRPDAYGVTIRQEVPSRLKPGHLAFDAPALQASVPLGGDVKTIGDLVARVAKVVNAEIYADVRLAKLPVWTRGAESAPAGDILKALCHAVTGAFRKVGPAFVLTDDLAGLGTRRAQLSEWFQDAQLQESQQREELDKQIRKQQPLQYVDFAPGDPLAPGREMMARIEQQWNTWEGRYQGQDLPVAALTSVQQERVRESVASWNAQRAEHSPNRPGIRSDRVRLTVRMRTSYLVPGVGTVDDEGFGWDSLSSMLPPPTGPPPGQPVPSTDPVKLPPSMATRALCVAADPAHPGHLADAAREARRRGLNQLWVDIGAGDAEGQRLLAAAIAAAKTESDLPVFGVVRLLQQARGPRRRDRDGGRQGGVGGGRRTGRSARREHPGRNRAGVGGASAARGRGRADVVAARPVRAHGRLAPARYPDRSAAPPAALERDRGDPGPGGTGSARHGGPRLRQSR